MSDDEHDPSFWLELEAASKGLTVTDRREQAEHLHKLFQELVAGDEAAQKPMVTDEADEMPVPLPE